jgi:hypothetical protein
MFSDPSKPAAAATSANIPASAMGKSPQIAPAVPAKALKAAPVIPAKKPAAVQAGTFKAGEVVDYLLKKAVKTPAQAPLSPHSQFVQDNIGQENWEARNAAGVPGLTQQEEQKMMEGFDPSLKARREAWDAQKAQREANQAEAYQRSPEARMQTMVRNREVDAIAAQARQMTEANNAAKAQNLPLPYDGSSYAPTYKGGILPDSAKSTYVPRAAPYTQPKADYGIPTNKGELLSAQMQNPFSARPASLLSFGAPAQTPYTPQQGSGTFNPQKFNLSPGGTPSPGFQLGSTSLSNPVNIAPPTTSAPATPPAGAPASARVKPPKITGTPGAVLGSNQARPAEVKTAAAWKGFEVELRKQGANEDFIMGMMKEANDSAARDGSHILSKLKDILRGSQTPDDTGLAADRHPIIPGLANKWLGLAGGAGLGALLRGETGLEQTGVLLPALGAMAGHHFLPHIMNRWKDAYGTGANQINPGTIALNKSHPINIPGQQE